MDITEEVIATFEHPIVLCNHALSGPTSSCFVECVEFCEERVIKTLGYNLVSWNKIYGHYKVDYIPIVDYSKKDKSFSITTRGKHDHRCELAEIKKMLYKHYNLNEHDLIIKPKWPIIKLDDFYNDDFEF